MSDALWARDRTVLANMLDGIRKDIHLRLSEAGSMLTGLPEGEEAYYNWWSQIRAALDDDHDGTGRCDYTLRDTINALRVTPYPSSLPRPDVPYSR